MTKIFFFSDKGSAPLEDAVFRQLASVHYWNADDGSVYGVCIPARYVDPLQVADRLEALGVDVLPGLLDPDNPETKDKIVAGLQKHGVTKGDKAKDVVKKMAAKSGNPMLRPHHF